jgi:NAD-dependent deacetylase
VALTGAGVSVESGIAPFRGPGGLWTKYGDPSPLDFRRFMADPAAWWENRLTDERENRRPEWRDFDLAQPNPAHHALARLETLGVLHHLITQNVDGLHQRAGSRSVTEIHGNRYRLRCTGCGVRSPRPDTFDALPPRCRACSGVLKFDTVMFGEPVPVDALRAAQDAAQRADCMLVVGTSAVVRPAAELPVITRTNGGVIIEVNPEASALTRLAQIAVRGAAGAVLPVLAKTLAGRLANPTA